jgi:hypothetical protein
MRQFLPGAFMAFTVALAAAILGAGSSAHATTLASYVGADPRLSHGIGTAAGPGWTVPAGSVPGFLSYGPYQTMAPGNYAASFTLVSPGANASNEVVATVDINDATHQRVLMSLDIRGRDLPSANTAVTFSVPFFLGAQVSVEYRVFYKGPIALTLNSITVASGLVLPTPAATPVPQPSPENYTVNPRSWMIGLNEAYWAGSLLAVQNLSQISAGNVAYQPLAETARWTLDLAANHHVGVHRDIIPLAMLAPLGPGDTTYWSELFAVLDVFKNYNLAYVVSFGSPMASWMLPPSDVVGWGTVCPKNRAEWPGLKNTLSWSIGQFLAAYGQSDPARLAWLKTHVFIDAFNEIDGVQSGGAPCTTPTEAASLTGGIAWVLSYYGIPAQMLTPSLVSGNAPYLQQYYQAGGIGLPNVHIYFPVGGTPASNLSFFRAALANFQAAVPPAYASRIYVTETGISLAVAGAPAQLGAASMSEGDRNLLYHSLITDPQVAAATEALLFWRLYDLSSAPTLYGLPHLEGAPWEARFGLVNSTGTAYNGVATPGLFTGISALLGGNPQHIPPRPPCSTNPALCY